MPDSLLSGRARRQLSAAALVEVLEEVVGGELDLLVAPFGGPVQAGDQAHAVQAAEVAVDEGVPGLSLVGGAVGEGQVPLGVLLPGMRLQVGVLVLGGGLDVVPDALEHVLAGVDELACPCHCLLVDRVGSHGRILAMRTRGDTGGDGARRGYRGLLALPRKEYI